MNRARYFGRSLLIAGAFIGASVGVGLLLGFSAAASGEREVNPGAIQALVLLLQVLMMWPTVCLGVKRLHDLGRPGAHYWLLLVPFYNLYLALQMLFRKGIEGPNAFGPDPLERRQLATVESVA